jgi:molybdopterin converting factor small subunit
MATGAREATMTKTVPTSGFRSTLQRLAKEPDLAERQRLATQFALQVELAIDAQGDNLQFALSHVEEDVGKKFDSLHEQLGDNNLLQSEVLRAIKGLQASVDTSAAETAARLGKLEDGQLAYNKRLDTVDARHTGQWEEAMSLLAESKEDRAELRRMYEARRDERAAEKAERDAHEAERDAQIAALSARLSKLDGGGDGN